MKLDSKKYKILFYVYSLFIILLVTLPINGSNAESPLNDIFVVSVRLDYLLHCAIFIPWAFLLWKMSGTNFRKNGLVLFLYFLLAILFAVATEGIQYVLPYRAFNINDLLANGLGVVLGTGVILLRTPVREFTANYRE